MTDSEVLQKALERAVENGYELVKAKDWIWQVSDGIATGLCVHILPDTEKIGLITYVSYPIAYDRIIFDHSFCKAMFGNFEPQGFKIVNGEFEHFGNAGWQNHIQQLALSEDRIKYLRSYLKEKN